MPTQSGILVGHQDFTSLASPNASFIYQIYHELLDRPVDGPALAYWSGLLNAGATRGQVLQQIESTPEYEILQVNSLFETYLHRPVDPGGLSFSLQLLNKPHMQQPGISPLDQLRTIILSSAEYLQVQGILNTGNGIQKSSTDAFTNNSMFVAALYQSLLGRAVDAGGQAFFSTELSRGIARATVVQQILASSEAKQQLVQGYYQSYLDRAADPGGLNAFASALAQGVNEKNVIQAILASDEFFSSL